MIKLKSLLTEGSKNVKILINGNKGDIDQNVAFSVYESDNVFVFLPKTSKDLDKIDLVNHDNVVDSLLSYLKKHTNLEFKWDLGYNSRGAGYGFKMDLDKILKKLK